MNEPNVTPGSLKRKFPNDPRMHAVIDFIKKDSGIPVNPNHNSLEGLQGGDVSSKVFFHLNALEFSKLHNLPEPKDIYEYWVLGGKLPAIGDEYGGGIVFYVADDQSYILVCSPIDVASNVRWCFNEKDTNPYVAIAGLQNLDFWPDSTTLQNGAINTDLIINALDALGQTGYAAKLCREYTGGGFTDWYLPTYWELDFMLRNLKDFGINFHTNPVWYSAMKDHYWSSSSGQWDSYHNERSIYRCLLSGGNVFTSGYEPDYNYTGSNPFDARWGYVRAVRRIPFPNLQIRNKENLDIKAGDGIAITLNDRVLTISAASGANPIVSEQLIGIVDGVNRIFTTSAPYISGSISVFVNGIKESGFVKTNETTITLDEAPSNVGFTDKIEAIYSPKN